MWQDDSQDTRREWFVRSAAGLSMLCLRPWSLVAQTVGREKIRFLVISDTHLGYRDSEGARKQWQAMAKELASAEGEFVLHLGDVVDGGREPQYPLYLETRATIGKPVHEIPGNHDPQELFVRHIRKEVDIAIDYQWLRLLLLNNARKDSHDGFVSSSQLKWLEEQLREVVDQRRRVILCMHVPAHDNKHPDRGWHVKIKDGQRELYELIERHRECVIALFHGHFHNGLRGWDDRAPVHELCFPSALYNQDRKLIDQKAPGFNLPEFRPGYTTVQLDGGLLKLTYKPVGVGVVTVKELNL